MDYTLAPLQGLSEANLWKTSIFMGLLKHTTVFLGKKRPLSGWSNCEGCRIRKQLDFCCGQKKGHMAKIPLFIITLC